MIYLLAPFLLCWFIIFTATRFIRYYRIVTEYKNSTNAVVVNTTPHVAVNKAERKQKLMDVTLECTVDDKINRSEITVPAAMAEEYKLGASIPISYKVSPNGTVHIASSTESVKKFMWMHLAALIVELAAFFYVWIRML